MLSFFRVMWQSHQRSLFWNIGSAENIFSSRCFYKKNSLNSLKFWLNTIFAQGEYQKMFPLSRVKNVIDWLHNKNYTDTRNWMKYFHALLGWQRDPRPGQFDVRTPGTAAAGLSSGAALIKSDSQARETRFALVDLTCWISNPSHFKVCVFRSKY